MSCVDRDRSDPVNYVSVFEACDVRKCVCFKIEIGLYLLLYFFVVFGRENLLDGDVRWCIVSLVISDNKFRNASTVHVP